MTKQSVTIDGVEYVRADAVTPRPTGRRAVVVVDRGWIFAGDVTREAGRVYLDRAVHVLSWESVGFAGMVADPKAARAKLKTMTSRVDIPDGAEIFCVSVPDEWGL